MNTRGKVLIAGLCAIGALSIAVYLVAQTAHSVEPAHKMDVHTTFRNLYFCRLRLTQITAAKDRADCSFYAGKPMYEKDYAACLDSSLDQENKAESIEAEVAACPKDRGTLEHEYFKATKEAARAGDGDAQACYVASHFSNSPVRSFYTEEDINEYEATAPQYVAGALARGDWRIVNLLSERFVAPPRDLLGFLDGFGQPETIYKMKKLLRLGATGAYAASLDSTMDGYIHPTGLAKGDALSESQKAAADKWAQETYTQYFSAQRPLTESPGICEPREYR